MAIFRFKQFAVQQDHCAMKLGTDGVLLGAWARVAQAPTILDIGTGTGVLALMAAQRQPSATIHAVELDTAAAAQAHDNFQQSPWANRLTAIHQSLQNYVRAPLSSNYDCLISNPPYYDQQQHSTIPETQRALARQTHALGPTTLLAGAAQLLAPQGWFSLILPIRESQTWMEIATSCGWWIQRRTLVHPRVGKVANRCLLELCRYPTTTEEQVLVLRQAAATEHPHDAYTETFRALHRDFLLFL